MYVLLATCCDEHEERARLIGVFTHQDFARKAIDDDREWQLKTRGSIRDEYYFVHHLLTLNESREWNLAYSRDYDGCSLNSSYVEDQYPYPNITDALQDPEPTVEKRIKELEDRLAKVEIDSSRFYRDLHYLVFRR